MIYPNKHIRIEDSIIYKMTFILDFVDTEMNIHELYLKTKKRFNNTDEFILSIDVLYILDMIEVDLNAKAIKYAKRDMV